MELNKKAQENKISTQALFGGFIKLFINKKGNTSVKKLNISKKKLQEFEKNVFLIYIKNRRFTYQILKEQSKLIKTKTSKK